MSDGILYTSPHLTKRIVPGEFQEQLGTNGMVKVGIFGDEFGGVKPVWWSLR